MSKTVCGISKLKKGETYGSLKECIDKRQVRKYGLEKVTLKDVDKYRTDNKLINQLTKDQRKYKLLTLKLKKDLERAKEKYEIISKKENADKKQVKELKELIENIKIEGREITSRYTEVNKQIDNYNKNHKSNSKGKTSRPKTKSKSKSKSKAKSKSKSKSKRKTTRK